MNQIYKDVIVKSLSACCGTAVTLLIEKGIPAMVSAIANKAKRKQETDENDEVIDGTAVVVEAEEES